MHAIIETGGKQFRVAPGDVIRVPKLTGDIGSEIEFSKVLAGFSDAGEVLAGTETADHKITGTITANDRAKKVLVFKFKRKKQYKRTIGHRQDYTEVRVGDIVNGMRVTQISAQGVVLIGEGGVTEQLMVNPSAVKRKPGVNVPHSSNGARQ